MNINKSNEHPKYKICFLTTISATLKAFVMDFAKYLHETGEFEVYCICDNDEDFAKLGMVKW